MEDFQSKYSGEQVEEMLDRIASGEAGGGGGGITVETDPVFSASPAASITEAKKTEWDEKYTKPSGGIPASDLAPDVFLQGEKGDKGDKGDQGEQGIQGEQGEQGPKGDDGVGIASVVQTTTSSADGGNNVMTVTLTNGTTSTFNVKNGSKGSNGTNGTNGKDGDDGATFTPSVDADGNLSWTNDKGLANPATVNIKGPKGDSGEGGGSGEDIRYFAEFTVEDVIEASATNNNTGKGASKLRIAAANNKLICIPYRNADKGYVIASYSYREYSDYSMVDVRLEYNGNVYMLYESENDDFMADYPINLSGGIVEKQIWDNFNIEIKDNTFYSFSVEGEFYNLTLGVFEILHKGSTIRFFSGHWTKLNGSIHPPSLEIVGTEVLWPNGVVPEIEIDTWYELSLTTSGDMSCCLAVLTPFKPVE